MQENLNNHIKDTLQKIDEVKMKSIKHIDTKIEEMQNESRKLEKDYISILGIFSSVVLAFMGGLSFSSSVLETMNSTNIFRLIFIVDFLGFVLTNIIYMLVSLIFRINDNQTKFFDIRKINCMYIMIAVLDAVFWVVLTKM